MSIEGGLFICYQHDFETGSVKKWDKHMYEIYHPLNVEQKCLKCGETNNQTIPHPERMVELRHMGQDAIKNIIGRKNVIVLTCQFCGKYCIDET